MYHNQVCDCGDDVCRANKGYVFVDSGISVCAAGCVLGSMPTYDAFPSASHIVVDESLRGARVPNTHADLRPGAAQRRDAKDSARGVTATTAVMPATGPNQSGREPLALRGRSSADRRTITELCSIIKLPDRVVTEAHLILDYVSTLDGREFKRRAMKRQALMIAIVCIACERNNSDYHGERLRYMCITALGAHADSKTYTLFGRQLRAMRISLSRALGTMAVAASEDYIARIVNHAWGRLGRSGLGEHDIARVTDMVVKMVEAWEGAETRFGDAIVPCAVYMRFGDDERTLAACDEYNYKLGTIARHVASVHAHVSAEALNRILN